MTPTTGFISLLNTLRGAPLSILVAMLASPRPLKRDELVVLTGYRRDAITAGVHKLDHLGLLHSPGPGQGWQLDLSAPGLGWLTTGEGARKAPPLSSIKDPLNLLTHPQESSLLPDTPAKKSPTGESEPAEPPIPEDIAGALRAAGISLNKRTRRMALLPHITPGYIRAHYLELEQAGRHRETGLLVTILESGRTAPRLGYNGHLHSCRCDACRRRGYAAWNASPDPYDDGYDAEYGETSDGSQANPPDGNDDSGWITAPESAGPPGSDEACAPVENGESPHDIWSASAERRRRYLSWEGRS